MLAKLIIFTLGLFAISNVSGEVIPAVKSYTFTDKENETIKAYNENFGTRFQTAKEVEADSIAREMAYYSKVRACEAGTYDYPKLDKSSTKRFALTITFAASKITPNQDYCDLVTLSKDPDGNIQRLSCHFKKEDLELFKDEIATYDDTVKGSSPAQTKLFDAVMKNCKMSENSGASAAP